MESKGFVLNCSKYKENSVIFDFFTINGLLSFLAKGIRNNKAKNKSSLMEMSCISVEYIKKGCVNVFIKSKIITSSVELLDSFYGTLAINYFKEIFYKIVKYENDSSVISKYYDIFQAHMIKIVDDRSDFNILYHICFSFLETLKLAGYSIVDFYNSNGNKEKIKKLTKFKNKETDNNEIITLIKEINSILFDLTNIKICAVDLL